VAYCKIVLCDARRIILQTNARLDFDVVDVVEFDLDDDAGDARPGIRGPL